MKRRGNQIMIYGVQLIIGGFLFFFPKATCAQASNDSIFKHLLTPYFETNGYRFYSLSGFEIRSFFPQVQVDTTIKTQLNISNPRIYYSKVSSGQYLREVKFSAAKLESEKITEQFLYRDTLSAKLLREVNKSSSEPFRSQDPTPLGKWLKPVLLIVGSVGGILSLFYIRSR